MYSIRNYGSDSDVDKVQVLFSKPSLKFTLRYEIRQRQPLCFWSGLFPSACFAIGNIFAIVKASRRRIASSKAYFIKPYTYNIDV